MGWNDLWDSNSNIYIDHHHSKMALGEDGKVRQPCSILKTNTVQTK